MSFEADEEILQDFLVEAGEILEQLSEQLVELENDVDNADLLNAIFRGFHTVKGGAGFLALNELVDVCHGAENIFDLLRTGQRKVNSELMDTILSALDTINDMFALVKNREALMPAEAELLAELHRLSQPESAGAEVSLPEPSIDETESVDKTSSDLDGDMSEDEFERLLDELHGSGSHSSTTTPAAEVPVTPESNNEISDDEFESLLDELHGQGAFSSEVKDTSSSVANNSSDEINDDEFESLLDELHGKGNAPKASSEASITPVQPSAVKPTPTSANRDSSKPAAMEEVKPSVSKPPVAKKTAQPSTPQGETTVRVDTKRLDKIMNMVGELVLVRNRLTSLGLTSDDENLTKAVSNLDAVTTDLQGAVMKTRM